MQDDGRSQPVNWRLSLLGGWRLERDGVLVDVVLSTQRLLALVALRGTASRPLLAATLWPDSPEMYAATNLRSALHRVHRRLPGVLRPRRDPIALNPAVRVDVDNFSGEYRPDSCGDSLRVTLVGSTADELLPGWFEEWVLVDRERFRQLWLHAVEERAGGLAAEGEYGPALDAALLAVQAEPLRESAHRLVVAIHLAEGNVSEALRSYEHYRRLLHHELGVGPTAHMTRLLAEHPSSWCATNAKGGSM